MLYEKDRIVELLENISSAEGLEDTTDFYMVEDGLAEDRKKLNDLVEALSPSELEEYEALKDEVNS